MAWFLAVEKIQMTFRQQIILLLSFNIYCADINTIAQSYNKDGPFVAGENLTRLKSGIHFLENANEQQTELVIAVHGLQTKGFEWVYPLINLDKETNRVAFFRWKTNGCPTKATKELLNIIENEINNYSKISLIGHSYGGIVLAKLLEKDYSKNIEFHIVASGIAGGPRLNSFCGYTPPKQIGKNVVAYQWMTQKHLDGAFKDLETDTQIQKIEGVSAVRLPEIYKDNTLTHNWSISWLVDYLNKNRDASANS